MKLTAAAQLAFAGARELSSDDACFVGIGIPSDAAVLAKHTHAPDMSLIFESGVIGSDPLTPPLSTGSPSVAEGALMITDGLTVFGELQAGRIDVGLLSAAQVDQRGNLNSTAIGSYSSPKLRMVGSGGAHDIACLVGRVIILMPHDPRRFVDNVDFVTSPGTDAEARKSLKLGGGPSALVTERARFSFETGLAQLSTVMPGYSEEDALDGISWPVERSENFKVLEAFSDTDLSVARQRLTHLF
ncbi:MAG: CoA-transferase subunit beta [Rhodospirillaceae bacterium]|jgi:glutaconate CoA-transferase subunit B|nr:CoA-transferase subunit beta [Rhodospirillales bacterium]MBT3905883.1 CoA-transferase subunit beta [Rhodospirillaceae bacterium]MBT4702805.1 CoA-transferase subunit beta [Rhodospirillaceae bacterium]MBT5036838.1 CoA-transferase subunit beta [Rhodospirillaceae bacterium]MBT6218417.1 CoA-transferase subunit beta [Rhodospirillaceae bacterium]